MLEEIKVPFWFFIRYLKKCMLIQEYEIWTMPFLFTVNNWTYLKYNKLFIYISYKNANGFLLPDCLPSRYSAFPHGSCEGPGAGSFRWTRKFNWGDWTLRGDNTSIKTSNKYPLSKKSAYLNGIYQKSET